MMKTWIGAAITALLGLILGVGMTQLEFAGLGDHFLVSNLSIPAVGKAKDTSPKQAVVPAGAPAPRARIVGDDVFEFGTIEQHTIGSHVFQLTNDGNAPLKLVIKGTTCKCTVGKLATNEIKPGEIADIEVSYKAEKPTPNYQHGASISTNDPKMPLITFSVSGIVENRVFADPSSVVLTRISANAPSTARVGIFAKRLPEFKITDLTFTEPATADFFEVATEPLPDAALSVHEGADGGMLLTIRTKPGLPNGPFRQNLRVKTNSSKDINVSISGTVIADVSIVGGTRYHMDSNLYDLGVVESADGASEKLLVLVKGPNREKMKVKVTRVKPEALKVVLGKPTHGDRVTRYPLQLSIAPGARPANYLGAQSSGFGMIVLETDDPGNKQVKVRVRFAIR